MKPAYGKAVLFIYLLINILFSSYAFAASDQNANFTSGIKYFKQKQYKKALGAFEMARKHGQNSATIEYNIGVCHYKLGQYTQASNTFITLLGNTKYRQIAAYNLGLVAAKQQNKKSAIAWFKKSISTTGNQKINALAVAALDKLGSPVSSNANPKRWDAVLIAALGSDDNVRFSASNSPSQQQDQYLEMFILGERKLTQRDTFDINYYQLKYFSVSAGNFQQAQAGIRHTFTQAKWHLTPHLQISQSRLTDGNFQRQIDLKFSGLKQLDRNRYIKLRLRYSHIVSLNHLYDYLEGNRQQARGDYVTRTSFGKLRLRYQLELNDRQNTPTVNYSPTRHMLQARLKQRYQQGWGFTERVQYRISTYDAAAGVTRKDNQFRLKLSAEKRLAKNWRSGIRYDYINNDSNVAAEKYTRNDIQAYANYSF